MLSMDHRGETDPTTAVAAPERPAASGAPSPPGQATAPGAGRRCRSRAQPFPLDGLRPTDVIGAFFLAGVGTMLAGAAVAVANAIDPWTWGRWLALHLVFVGGISQLVLGASQFFAGAYLATDPPRRPLIRTQIGGWNAGSVLVALGVPLGSEAMVYAGAGVLLATLGLYAAGLAEMRRRSLGSAPWATRWYLAATACLVIGVVAGAMLANGIAWRHGNLLGAHMVLNLGGWFGAAIVGTLHTFFPSLTHSRLRLPRLQGPTFLAWAGGVAILAAGYGFSLDAAVVAGWSLLALGAAMLAANLLGSLIASTRPLSLPARVVAAAQVFLVVGVAVAAVGAFGAGPDDPLSDPTRAAVATLLVSGWIGLTVLGSLLHLLALLLRVRDLRRGMPEPRPARDLTLTLAAALGVAAAAAADLGAGTLLDRAGEALLLAAYVLLGARVALLGARVVATARPRI
jgi:nitrite reductase (NO-forming)